jgi:NAD(P)-dependent dehydrogenase (short-subunit alcohol dehydrogenase family)
MRTTRKPLGEQVIVITGASSGIGLVTANQAAERGACVVLAARNEADLDRAATAIRVRGGRALPAVADVAEPDQVEALAGAAQREFGRIDTWVNNAAVSMYGPATDLLLDDMRRQMEVNFWGTVYGILTAVRQMGQEGGTLINVGSVLSDRAVPLQSIYCAAKHATRAFTDSLRMELELEEIPIAVSYIKPGSIDTPFFEKARTYLDEEPQPIPPVYSPEVVARAILHCAERPIREVTVGGITAMLGVGQRVSPRLTDHYLERHAVEGQKSGKPLAPDRKDNLYDPVAHDGGETGHTWEGRVLRHSAFTAGRLHPKRAAAMTVGLGLATWLGLRAIRRNGNGAR